MEEETEKGAKYRVVLEYDGSGFSGWQRQDGRRTVEGVVVQALSRILSESVEIHGASRTDAGVHARGQVAHFVTARARDPVGLRRGLSARLPEDVVARAVEPVPPSFHARFDPVSKWYRYTIRNHAVRGVLDRRTALHEPRPLDLERMRGAAEVLLGRHDFRAFRKGVAAIERRMQARGEERRPDSVRTVTRLDVTRERDYVFIDAEADGFLHNMVRTITGTLIRAGLGRVDPEALRDALAAGDRSRVGPTVAPHGLCLEEVRYPSSMLSSGGTAP